MALRYPELIERMVLDGHELGNHTYNHYRLPLIPISQIPSELNRTRDVLTSIVGSPTRLFRPPGGEYNDAIQKIIAQEGYTNMLWTDDPADLQSRALLSEKITELVLRDITPGGIILLHSGLHPTMNALPEMVARLRAQGYSFVTCSELIQRGGGLLHLQNIPARISRTRRNLETSDIIASISFSQSHVGGSSNVAFTQSGFAFHHFRSPFGLRS